MSAAEKYNFDSVLVRVRELPTLPTIVYELSNVINDPMSSTQEVVKLMEKDQSMTIKVLKLVNSAYYSIPGGVSNLSRAIAFLGFDTVNQLVLASSIIDTLSTENANFKVGDFWVHSMGVGIAAETIAKHVKHPLPSDAFTSGLIHDLGKIVLLTLEPEIFLEAVRVAQEKGITFLEAEESIGLPNHTMVGSALAQQWRLPIFLQQTIKYHHTVEPERRVGLSAELQRLVDMTCLANLLVHALKFGNSGHSKVINARKELLLRLTIDPLKDLKPLLQKIKMDLDRSADF